MNLSRWPQPAALIDEALSRPAPSAPATWAAPWPATRRFSSDATRFLFLRTRSPAEPRIPAQLRIVRHPVEEVKGYLPSGS